MHTIHRLSSRACTSNKNTMTTNKLYLYNYFFHIKNNQAIQTKMKFRKNLSSQTKQKKLKRQNQTQKNLEEDCYFSINI